MIILNTAAFWNPEKMLKARCVRESLTKVNQQIARKAAELLEQRNELHNTQLILTAAPILISLMSSRRLPTIINYLSGMSRKPSMIFITDII